jgi:signal transduction histidine kinase
VRRRSVTSLGDTAEDGNSASTSAIAGQGSGPQATSTSQNSNGTLPSGAQASGGAQVSAGTARSTTARGPRPAGSRFALSNWRVRWRLAAVIAIPTITAAILGAIQISSDASSYEAYGRVQHLVQLNAAVVTLAWDLENERDDSAGFVASGRQTSNTLYYDPMLAAQAATNAERNSVNQMAVGVTVTAGYQSGTVADLTGLLDSVNSDLKSLRQVVLSTSVPASKVIEAYTSTISEANAFSESVGNGANDAELQGNVTTLAALMRVENEISVQRAILYAALSSPQALLTSVDLASLEGAQFDQQAEEADFNSSTNLAEQQVFTNTVAGTAVDQASQDETLAESMAEQSPNSALTRGGQLTPGGWNTEMTTTVNQTQSVAVNGSQGLAPAISARASALKSHWASELLWTSIITFLLLLLVLMVSTLVARSLTRPLRKLRSDALDVAGHRLPDIVRRLSQSEGSDEGVEIEPIGVSSTDEIGEVARAFDQVHREAVRLAADEAMLRGNLNAMFINLSRRSQSLIERQLSLIDSLEQSEQDPGRLSSLFRLDHLATRMRRNSENLLVLAGHEVARRWSQPVPLVDVLRAAISEIEQYERVVLNVQPGIVVVGQAVNDIVHLVAEIVENATTFSPEDTQVYVSGQPLSSGGVLLDITDNGVGISDQEMSHANWRLDNPPVVDVAVSRRMGLFVVGRLAARHGVRVRLRHAQAGGLTALIWLPETVAAPEVAPPLGRLRRFEADDFGPAPSLSAPTPGIGSAASQATAAARIPRFSSSGPSTSPSFTPSGPQPPLPPVPSQAPPPQIPLVPPLPMRNGSSGAPQPANGSLPDASQGTTAPGAGAGNAGAGHAAPSGPSRLPSFGGGQPPVRGADGPSVFDMPAAPGDDDLYDLSAPGDLSVPGGLSGPGSLPLPSGLSVPGGLPLPPLGAGQDNVGNGTVGNGPIGNGTGVNGNGAVIGNGHGTSEITIPPAATQDQRLPIFDSLESDWFRRSGKPMTANRANQPAVAAAAPQTWTSPADEGWRAAQVAAAPAAGETTQAGLPKRVPRANLVPGSVGGGDDAAAAAAASAPARTADDIRARLSSFQRGVREGRAAAPQIEEQ